MKGKEAKQVFLVGAKGLGSYGGYETFVCKLTEYHQNNSDIQYHVACKANGVGATDETSLSNISRIKKDKKGNITEYEYQGARCFKVKIPEKIGPAQAIFYDVKSLKECCKYIQEHQIENPIIYIMACRIGPFIKYYYKKIHALGGKIYLNPDGHEWKRAKWNGLIRKYWKWSEQLMVKWSDLVICDSQNIETYIHGSYDGKGRNRKNPTTTYIAYGAETRESKLSDDDVLVTSWYARKEVTPKNYYLVVGRFVPENNYEIMIREFMRSKSEKDFVIITPVNGKFLAELENKLHFKADKRIKFVGTVYDQELLMKIRQNAYAYFHGHEVGGTNPSLLEAMSCTKLNLLLNVGFNKEVGVDAALYWNKKNGNLASLIDKADALSNEKIEEFGVASKKRIKDAYSWKFISNRYAEEFLE